MRVLMSGGGGRLGRLLVAWLRERDHDVVAPPRDEVDWAEATQVQAAVAQHQPHRLLLLASWTDVARAQLQPGACVRDTVLTTQHAIAAATDAQVPLLYVSTDYVHAVLRQDAAGVYAAAKLVAEQLVLLAGGYVARVAFTTPEQVAGWQWANGYSYAHRCWVDELVPLLGTWAGYPAHQLQRVVELGGPHPVTPAQLLATRYPQHPALQRIVTSRKDAELRRLPVQPADTAWRSL